MPQKEFDQMSEQEFNEMMQNLKLENIDVTRIEREARALRARAVREMMVGFGAWVAGRFAAIRGTQAGQTA